MLGCTLRLFSHSLAAQLATRHGRHNDIVELTSLYLWDWQVACGGAPYGESKLVFVANDWHASLLPVYLQASQT